MQTERQSQHGTPLVIRGLAEESMATTLGRVALFRQDAGQAQHDEYWLQQLIHRHPQVLPVQEIEPAFEGLVPVCLELPTPAGPVDNLLVTGSGDIVLAECKLWRNPQARREVVAQIIDYAHGMAGWSYEELDAAVRRGRQPGNGTGPASLYAAVQGATELGEPEFVDAVSRNLRLGRMLLLIVGDGIREGVESLGDYLQRHAGFHFTLAMVELPVFGLPEGGYVVMPRTVARTVNIERGIVDVADDRAAIRPPEQRKADATQPARRTSISRERFHEELEANLPGAESRLQAFLHRAEELGVFPQFYKAMMLKWQGAEDAAFTVGGVTMEGEFITYSIGWTPDNLGRLDIAHRFLERLAEILGGKVRKTARGARWEVVMPDDTLPSFDLVLQKQDTVLEAMRGYIDACAQVLGARGA